MKTVYLDTETTGLDADDEIVEIAIVDDNENVLVNTLVRPINQNEWPGAENIHGISPTDVENAPTQAQISDDIRDAVSNCRVVIYNANYDSQYLPELEDAAEISCCMEQFTEFNQDKRTSLMNATDIVGYERQGSHRALADTLSCRAVWKAIQ